MQAVVLAAGEGQRLRPFTVTKPKVMIKVANKPILEYVVDALNKAGIRDIVIVVGYRKSRVMDYFGDGSKWNVKIKYAIQEKQLGTAHALRYAKELVNNSFILVSGDNIIDSETVKKLEEWSIAYKISDESSKYGVIELHENEVIKIVEKPKEPISNLVNTGIYMLGREVFEFIDTHTNITDVINEMIENGYKFKAVEAEKWLDIVYPWDIIKVNQLAMDFEGAVIAGRIEKAEVMGDVEIGPNSVIRYGAYVNSSVIGRNCEVGQNAVIKNSSIGDNVRISAFSYVENCVIGDNVIIGPHSYIMDSVVDSGSIIKPKFTTISEDTEVVIGSEVYRIKAGAFIGENCRIGANVTVEAGSIIGNNCKVSSNRLISGRIPDNAIII